MDSNEAYLFRMTGALRSIFGHALYDGVADNALGKWRIAKRPSADTDWAPAREAAGLAAG